MAQGKSDPTNSSPDVLQVQHQIRANAAELQDYFADLYSWEKSISQEEAARKQSAATKASQSLPQPRRQKVTAVSSSVMPLSSVPAKKAADAHTYDKGYKKWEKFDVDAALHETDGDKPAAEIPKPTVPGTAKKIPSPEPLAGSPPPTRIKPREEIEREEGNEHYKRGDYVAAIKSYTRALGFNSRNVVVLSNRAMAYLKNKEYSKAEDDCTLALKIDSTHVKSYSRRGTARNSLGKHRLALSDFERALELDPKSKQTASQIAATKDLMRTAIKRAPKRTNLIIKTSGESPKAAPSNVPKLEELVDKENASRLANKKIVVVREETAPTGNHEPSAPSTTAPPIPMTVSLPVADASLPKLPKKAAKTSYEFLRVWKTLAPKGDSARAGKLAELRATYLQMHPPTTFPTVFKNSIDSELLCEMFAAIRRAMDVGGLDDTFALNFVAELPRVPRFSMVVMFLSDKEKADVDWVIGRLAERAEGEIAKMKVLGLRSQYDLS